MHRLDTDTSGCLLFARTAKARSSFQQAFEARTVEKYYLAIVASEIGEEQGVIEVPLPRCRVRKRAGEWSPTTGPRRNHAVAAIGRPRWADARRVPAADGTHAPDPRACARGVRSRDRRRPGVRRARRSNAAPCRPASGTARTEARDRCRCPVARLFRRVARCGLRTSTSPKTRSAKAFFAATGPGGQNVNKVATAVQLRVDLFKLGLHPDAYERLKQIAGSRVTGGGELLITARRFRTQEANRTDARRRLAEMIAAAHMVQRKRKPTRPCRSREGRANRQEAPAQRSQAGARKGEFRLMYDFKIAAGDSATMYRDLASALEGLVAGETDAMANMANAAALIWETLPDLNWAGFYRNVGGELVLGPFQGRPACIRIKFGEASAGLPRRRARSAGRRCQCIPRAHRLRFRVEQRNRHPAGSGRRTARRSRSGQPEYRRGSPSKMKRAASVSEKSSLGFFS